MNPTPRGATSLGSDWDARSSSSMSEQSVHMMHHNANYDWAFAHLQPNGHPMVLGPAPALPIPSFCDLTDTYSQTSRALSPHSNTTSEAPSVASVRTASNRSAIMNFSWTPTAVAAKAHYEVDTATGIPAMSRKTVLQHSPGPSNKAPWPLPINAGRHTEHTREVGTESQTNPSCQPMGIADGVLQHQPTTYLAPTANTSGGVVPVPIQQPGPLYYAAQLSHSSVEGTAMHNSTYISSSEVMPYVLVDDCADIVRKLYLPYEVPRWQQLVRAAVLVVGIVEELHRDDGHAGLHHVVHPREYVSPGEWVSAWLDLQPRNRFSGPNASVLHPEMLLYPANNTLDDWGTFLSHPRQVIFRVLLGLKSCSPYVTHATKPALMSQDDWAAWADDVLWVMFQVLNHIKLYKQARNIPSQRSSNAQAPQGSRPLPVTRCDIPADDERRGWEPGPTEGTIFSARASSSGIQSSHTPQNTSYVCPEPREYRKRNLDDPEESRNKRLRATDTLDRDRAFTQERHQVEEDRDEDMEEDGEAY
ncbi:hypothetical protein K466DRAFT_602553 [Polyporus arcularius HHB13444]|uniref:Uncharacterized protein n=1 Tax=Polyporus arcularius HHB13444 TaxID=1314778 RepID=A0A5C3P2B7_9APHY|nr:hypothetical protein K466DRAFT_602553 [Polyporus arcularius HHB13444]